MEPEDALAVFPRTLPPGWRKALQSESDQEYFRTLCRFVHKERRSAVVYPAPDQVFGALERVDLPDVRVVVLGQDPYHGAGQAIGLSFAVPNDLCPKPPSLLNIGKELQSDLGVQPRADQSDLLGWARQGVLLLNTILTVRAGEAFSHRDHGWEEFTDRVLQTLSARKKPIIFILWGAAAQRKKGLIPTGNHLVIEAPHPSPLSAYRGFFGSRPFSKVNAILEKEWGQSPIDWSRITL